ncbi:subtilisin-like protease SBT5.6 [Juglans microcarpa x Juglans regia]|uniref:subtilisin-like protease SBT5.6 n=1 Tax=Juglans microcarpa x Juglans regia TaxID=2249226 RepID=UPI001B7F744B|nr:subtilisin-like protease SBT5.6 [Juglans microcarpa x Juglans regia]
MTRISLISILLLLPLILVSCADKQVYMVNIGQHSGEKAFHEIEDSHHSYLLSVKKTEEEARASLLYSYKHSINGFAALLSTEEASKLSELEEVVSVSWSHPRKYSLHTTRSWDFIGLQEEGGHQKQHAWKGEDLLSKARYGKDVIVGVLDSGVWPESNSFSDKGMGPIPKSWKGICQTGVAFNSSHCNRKLIGARYYLKSYEAHLGPLNTTEDYRSPRDKDGHGTHTASTVGGRRVLNVSAIGGFAHGIATGGAPLVRLAIYKVCWPIPGQSKVDGNTCFAEDMLAAIDDAIGDGVNVLSVSIGTKQPFKYTEDYIAIGALHATKKNIVVACSAGNQGPAPSTLSNPAPWIITVGASSVDRQFIAPVVLGNGLRIEGQTVTPSKLENKLYPLVYAADVVNPNVSKEALGQCLPGSLSPEKVRGKIVLCMRGLGSRAGKGMEVKMAGGFGFILGNSKANGAELSCDAHVLPASAVSYDDAVRIVDYINSSKNPMATIIPAKTVIGTKPAPFMASFSSRGPNVIDPYILKPDITAPGLNILAAWSEADPPTKLSHQDNRIVKYNIFSGTSMSCPHVSAAAALLKAIHPTWSSAAIRSALMTTAGLTNNMGSPLTDNSGKTATPFAYGSGHLRPTMAADPGLVYDASHTDYLLYLCSTIGSISKFDPTFKCPKAAPKAINLNYPSIAIPKLNDTITVQRTVTNVGDSKSVYSFTAKPPLGFSIKVSPNVLSFDDVGQKKSFTITVKVRREMLSKVDKDEYAFGWYSWADGKHIVRSPMAISLAY